MPPYPTRSYVCAHPSFRLDDGSEIQSPSKRSPSKQSSVRQSPYAKQSPARRSQRNGGPSKRPKVKVMTIPTLRDGSVQPTPRTIDPTTPHSWNPPANEDLARAPRKLKRTSNLVGGDDGSWLAIRGGVREDVSPLTSLAPGSLPVLPEVEAEDDTGMMQREYVKMMKGRETISNVHEQWEEKENLHAANISPETNMDADRGASSAVIRDYPVAVRSIGRTDTEEVFN